MLQAKSPPATRSVASLFTGIGGFDLGFQDAGFSSSIQCEIDEFCLAVLDKHWPTVPKKKDIREVNAADIPPSEVWVGGFPCQDVSVARGTERKGLKGRHSSLFYEFSRLVEEGRPRVLLLENVPGLLSSHGGKDFAIILSTLAELGYGLGWRVLNSRYFGVPQSRRRVFVVGCHRDPRGSAEILFEPERRQRNATPRRKARKKPVSPFKEVLGDPGGEGPVTPAIAYCLYAQSARHTGTDWSRNYASYPSRGEVRRLTPTECEGVMAFPKNWTLPQDSGRDWNGIDTLRYHALGNAVTPPVVEWLARRIATYLLPEEDNAHDDSQTEV